MWYNNMNINFTKLRAAGSVPMSYCVKTIASKHKSEICVISRLTITSHDRHERRENRICLKLAAAIPWMSARWDFRAIPLPNNKLESDWQKLGHNPGSTAKVGIWIQMPRFVCGSENEAHNVLWGSGGRHVASRKLIMTQNHGKKRRENAQVCQRHKRWSSRRRQGEKRNTHTHSRRQIYNVALPLTPSRLFRTYLIHHDRGKCWKV